MCIQIRQIYYTIIFFLTPSRHWRDLMTPTRKDEDSSKCKANTKYISHHLYKIYTCPPMISGWGILSCSAMALLLMLPCLSTSLRTILGRVQLKNSARMPSLMLNHFKSSFISFLLISITSLLLSVGCRLVQPGLHAVLQRLGVLTTKPLCYSSFWKS